MTDKTGPLQGLRVLVTRPKKQAAELCDLVSDRGGVALSCPLFEIRPLALNETLQAIKERLNEFKALIFISRNAVLCGLSMFGNSINTKTQHLFAVGRSTAAELQRAGFTGVIYPEKRADSEGVLSLPELQTLLQEQAEILIIRGVGGREFLAQQLHKQGASVVYAEVYERVAACYDPATDVQFWQQANLDIVILTSCEMVDQLLDRIPEEYDAKLKGLHTVVMSDRVASYVRDKGFVKEPCVIERSDDHGIVEKCEEIARSILK